MGNKGALKFNLLSRLWICIARTDSNPPEFKKLFSNSNQKGLIRIFDGVCSHSGNGRNVGPNTNKAYFKLTRSSAIAQRPARRSVLVEMLLIYCCTRPIANLKWCSICERSATLINEASRRDRVNNFSVVRAYNSEFKQFYYFGTVIDWQLETI